MDLLIIILLVVVFFTLIYLIYKTSSSKSSIEATDLLNFSNSLNTQIQDIRKEIDSNSRESRGEIEKKLNNINKQINDYHQSSAVSITQQFKESNKVIKDVTTELEKIKGTNEQVLSFANQMKTLERILGNQKQRGVLGEIQLENLLANVLPPELFQMQYSFSNKEIVDAIVRVGDFIIPVDAKFSLDNYNKMIESTNKDELAELEKKFKADIKNRIDETSKYIRPNEKTTDSGDAVDIIGMGAEKLDSTVTGVEMFRKILDRGEAGDNVGILLRGIEKTDISRGMVICKKGSVTPHSKFKAEVYILKKEEGGRHTPLHNNYRPQFYVRTTDVTGTIALPSGVEMVMPGDNLTITVELIQPIAMSIGLRFAIREGGRTVGAGQVTEILD